MSKITFPLLPDDIVYLIKKFLFTVDLFQKLPPLLSE